MLLIQFQETWTPILSMQSNWNCFTRKMKEKGVDLECWDQREDEQSGEHEVGDSTKNPKQDLRNKDPSQSFWGRYHTQVYNGFDELNHSGNC